MAQTEESGTATPREEWEQHNESFQYSPPDEPPELWSEDEYTELYDRIISNRQTWECDQCTKPFGSLRAARRHVESQHSERLIEQAVRKQDND